MAKTTSFALVIIISSILVFSNAFSIKPSVGFKPTTRSLNYRSHFHLAAKNEETDSEEVDFWAMQKQLAENMNTSVDARENRLKREQRDEYDGKVSDLVSETFYFSILIFSALWLVVPNPFTPISYLLGAVLGTAYTYGLGKFVSTLGGSVYDMEDVQGSGVGNARFAFLIVLFVFIGKFRVFGLQEIPAIMGFFTYQISTLSQGIKDAGE